MYVIMYVSVSLCGERSLWVHEHRYMYLQTYTNLWTCMCVCCVGPVSFSLDCKTFELLKRDTFIKIML